MYRSPKSEFLKETAIWIHCHMPRSSLGMSIFRQASTSSTRKTIPYSLDIVFCSRIQIAVFWQACIRHKTFVRVANELVESRKHWPIAPSFDTIRNERLSSECDMVLMRDVDELLHLQRTDIAPAAAGVKKRSRGFHRRHLIQRRLHGPAHRPPPSHLRRIPSPCVRWILPRQAGCPMGIFLDNAALRPRQARLSRIAHGVQTSLYPTFPAS